jgi:hypothetical protein
LTGVSAASSSSVRLQDEHCVLFNFWPQETGNMVFGIPGVFEVVCVGANILVEGAAIREWAACRQSKQLGVCPELMQFFVVTE